MRKSFRVWWARLSRAFGLRSLLVVVIFGVPTALALSYAATSSDYSQNLALNLGSELIGSFLILFALTPMLRRAQRGQVVEHRRMNYDWFNDRLFGARKRAKILHTFSRIFGPPFDSDFFKAVDALIRAKGQVQILLMHPDSPAAGQRTEELRGRWDVAKEIRANLLRLNQYQQQRGLEGLEVRLYDESPAVTLYQWDDQGLIAFLPIGGLSGDTIQLEISMESGLGGFAARQFDELWQVSSSFADYQLMPVTVGAKTYRPRFVILDSTSYLADGRLIADLARGGESTVQAGGQVLRAEVVPGESTLEAELNRLSQEKYGRKEDAFVALVPLP
ncbi:hypothetical protein [Catelliglobosispora koreensis]|uniref:hypothetical protein n=1 Tax=Catelliglobosispora koreensis TaxID=129052 RepID=UPI0012F8566F|nr:hypothetical protein [Catelliglobosispora koreensis]